MQVIVNESKLTAKEIESFFEEEKVREYMFKRSKSDPIRFPWDTKAPIVYKYGDQFIKVHGLKRRYHFFTGTRVATLLSRSHEYLNKHKIKTVQPNILAVKGKYSIVGTLDIKKYGLKLLSEADTKTIKESTIRIHDKLVKVDRYHGDNKPDNSAIDPETREISLLDIDSIEAPIFFGLSRWKLRRKTLESLNRKVKRLDKKIEGK